MSTSWVRRLEGQHTCIDGLKDQRDDSMDGIVLLAGMTHDPDGEPGHATGDDDAADGNTEYEIELTLESPVSVRGIRAGSKEKLQRSVLPRRRFGEAGRAKPKSSNCVR
ncbi:hypothetical protein R3P38DRAFT_2810112 [Favolaschia claudopus]|uniref:Uncharacterized protein n=1 Tax=Favolaschia claudopus TaxID=2862362 RepID=A0AAV9ZCN6_9AGAR